MDFTDRVARLMGEQPWPGYDDQDAVAIASRLDRGDAQTARQVKRYERDHKNRPAVITAAERRLGR
jgi:hypothetical protein